MYLQKQPKSTFFQGGQAVLWTFYSSYSVKPWVCPSLVHPANTVLHAKCYVIFQLYVCRWSGTPHWLIFINKNWVCGKSYTGNPTITVRGVKLQKQMEKKRKKKQSEEMLVYIRDRGIKGKCCQGIRHRERQNWSWYIKKDGSDIPKQPKKSSIKY